MSTAIEPEIIESTTGLIVFSPTEAALVTMRDNYGRLTIKDQTDKAGLAAVSAARLECKNIRCDIEARRKAYKEPLLERGKMIDDEAKRLTAIIRPTEAHLIAEEKKAADWVEAERHAAAKKLEEERRAAELAERARVKAEQDAAAAKLAAERAELDKLRAEAQAAQRRNEEALAAQRAEMEAERRKLEEAQRKEAARQAAEQKKIDDARRAEEARVEGERRKLQAEQDRTARIERERLAAIAAEEDRKAKEEVAKARKIEAERRAAEAEVARKLREESLRPDKERLARIIDAIKDISIPPVSNDAVEARIQIQQILSDAAADVATVIAMMK